LAAAQWHYRRRSGRETRGSIVCHFGGPEALTIFGGTLIVLFASGKDSRGSSRRRPRIVVVRQQYTFSPPDTVREIEDYTLHLEAVTILELHIVPILRIRPAATSVMLAGHPLRAALELPPVRK
jgi:hypothetical protein